MARRHNIGIDVMAAVNQNAGIAHYQANLVRELARLDSANGYTLVYLSSDRRTTREAKTRLPTLPEHRITMSWRRWALAPPWALWTLMMLLAAGVRTSEGDYLLSGNDWVGLVMILVGSLTFAVYSYRMILRRLQP